MFPQHYMHSDMLLNCVGALKYEIHMASPFLHLNLNKRERANKRERERERERERGKKSIPLTKN